MLCQTKSLLWISLLVATALLVSGLAFCLASLDRFAFGLYFILIAIVGYILAFSFCIVEPRDRSELTIANKMWSKAQKSLRRPRGRASNDAAAEPGDTELGLVSDHIKEKVAAANLRDFGAEEASGQTDETPSPPPVVFVLPQMESDEFQMSREGVHVTPVKKINSGPRDVHIILTQI